MSVADLSSDLVDNLLSNFNLYIGVDASDSSVLVCRWHQPIYRYQVIDHDAFRLKHAMPLEIFTMQLQSKCFSFPTVCALVFVRRKLSLTSASSVKLPFTVLCFCVLFPPGPFTL